jgi:ribonuclease Y
MTIWNYILIGAALIVGFPISYVLWDKSLHRKRRKIIHDAETEAEVIKKEKILQAKE